jgi:hypothetical protein
MYSLTFSFDNGTTIYTRFDMKEIADAIKDSWLNGGSQRIWVNSRDYRTVAIDLDKVTSIVG